MGALLGCYRPAGTFSIRASTQVLPPGISEEAALTSPAIDGSDNVQSTVYTQEMALKPTLHENEELSVRIEQLRQLCGELDKALGAADRQRELIAKMKLDADAVYKALTTKS